jgi:penicillin-binding protein 1A
MVKKRKKTPFKALRVTLITILSLFILSLVASLGVVFAIIKDAPPLDVNQILTLNEPSVLYDDKGKFMDVVVTNKQRTVLSSNEMPQDLKNAFVSIEDERFYKHGGIDLRRITSSLFIDIKNRLKGQSTLQGASTITQQLLKNTLLSSEVSLKRKIQEMYLAIQLEKYLTKDQILTAYMNTIFLGGRAYGVEAASEQYFNKKAKDLNLIQCAFIAGMPQSPSVYYPFSAASRKNPSMYLDRTKTVLMKMHDNGYITQQQYANALNDLANNKLTFQPPSSNSGGFNYEWFSIPVIDQVKKDLKTKYHYTDTEVQHMLMYGGLKIYTTMNKDMQDNTQKLLSEDSLFGVNSKKGKNGRIVSPQASAVVMDYHTGEVKVIVGGRGKQPPMSFNRAASDRFLRPCGSSIKPLAVYAPAIDLKEATAATVVDDSPLPDDLAKMYGSAGNPYNPQDDDHTFMGDMTLRSGLMYSRNLVAIKLENQIGLKTGAEYAEKFGLTLDNHDKTSIAALSLGELHHGTNPLTMTAAYGVFGNNGIYTYPQLYTKVVDRNGKVILENDHKTKSVLSPQAAYVMYDMLKGPVSPGGTGPKANFGDMPVRGKTGTSGDSRDLWFCGLTPYYSAAVWIGNDDDSVVNGISSNTAAGVWAAIMKPIHQNLQPKDIPMPQGVTTAVVCSESGKLPTTACYNDPTGDKTYSELFIDGTIPTEYCPLSHSYPNNNSIGNTSVKPFNGNDANTLNNSAGTINARANPNVDNTNKKNNLDKNNTNTNTNTNLQTSNAPIINNHNNNNNTTTTTTTNGN